MAKKPEIGVLLFSLAALLWVLHTIYGTPQQIKTFLNIKSGKQEEELRYKWGPAAWQTLHHMAAFYKENLKEEDKCGQHFRDIVKKHKPPATNRLDLVQYMCQIHNKVNVLKGKPEFKCDARRLSDLYGGDCGCI